MPQSPRRPYDPRLLEGPIVRSLFLLAIPIMLSNVLQVAYGLIDAFWVGRLGADAVASVSVSIPIMFLMVAAGLGFAVAGTTLIAQAVGARDHAMVNHVAAQTLLTVTAISIVLGFLGFFFSYYVIDLMGTAPQVRDNAVAFLQIAFIGLPFAFMYFMFQALLRGTGEVTCITTSTSASSPRSRRTRRASKAPSGWVRLAWMVQYSRALKASISSSRSTIMRRAGDWTRPADNPRCTLRQSTGERLKPTR